MPKAFCRKNSAGMKNAAIVDYKIVNLLEAGKRQGVKLCV